jgi:hypothetical protein
MHKRHNICSWILANYRGSLRLRWGAHKEPNLSRSKTSPNDHKDLVWFSTMKSPWMRWQYKLSDVHHNLGDSWTIPRLSRGKVPKRNEHTEIIDEVLAWRLSGSLKRIAQISLGSLDWSEAWERERFWAKWPTELGARGALIAPRRNLPIRVSETRTCPVSRAEHVRTPSLKPSLGIGHVRCLALTRVRAEESDMFGVGTGYGWKCLL